MEEDENTEDVIYHKMTFLCSKSEQCSPDIQKKIKESGGTDLMVQEIIGRLKKENYLNDLRFVKMYVNEKFKINKWGRIKIHYYLNMKGLKEDIIQEGLSEIDEEDYNTLLIQTMKDKAGSIKKPGKYEKMGQIIRFAQSRGFEPALIHRYLNQVIS
jgi:regulatory protein